VLVASAGSLFLTALMVANQAFLGMFRAALLGRILLYVVICWNMYRGRRWARFAFLVLMLVSTVKFALFVSRDWFQIVYVGAYGCLGATILFSRSVRAHFVR
jgi:hypothetical protein